MNYKKLGNTDLKVSTICLGTMTWGEQNTEAEAYEQMDFALNEGVNFWDTAELYAVPPKEETYGRKFPLLEELHKAQLCPKSLRPHLMQNPSVHRLQLQCFVLPRSLYRDKLCLL